MNGEKSHSDRYFILNFNNDIFYIYSCGSISYPIFKQKEWTMGTEFVIY